MKKDEVRNIIASSKEGEELKLIITEDEYPMLRKELVKARKFGFEITCWTKSMGKGVRKVIFAKNKDGDLASYIDKCKLK